MTPSKADRIMALYPSATRVRLNAGHCPHDEVPQAVNEAILKWSSELHLKGPKEGTTIGNGSQKEVVL